MVALIALGGIPECPRGGSGGFLVGTPENAAWLTLRAYQQLVSPGDGARCGMWPTCSRYAAEAVAAHGPIAGTVMAADRLLRRHEGWRYPVCTAYGRMFLLDAVP